MWRKIGIGIVVVVGSLFFLSFVAALFSPSSPATPSPTMVPYSNEPARPSGHEVRYLIQAGASSITYSTPDGGQEQVGNYVGDWDKVYDGVRAGTFLYVSAQNQRGSGDVTCTIYVDGQAVQTHTSSGPYVIATCDGRL